MLATEQQISIDGLHLMFPGTGIALVTAEWIRGLWELRPKPELVVFCPEGVDIASYELASTSVRWVIVARPQSSIDYLFRFYWGRRVAAQREILGLSGPHLIPYLYNYGNLRQNTVTVPDFVYRLYPDYGMRDMSRAWWNPRGRLPFRPIVRLIEEWAVSRAQKLIVYSSFVRSHACEVFAVGPEKFTVVPLAAPRWITEEREATLHLQDAGTTLPDRFALYIGGYGGRKNVPMLMRACGHVYEHDSSFRCVFAGLTPERIDNNPEFAEAWVRSSVRAAVICIPSLKNSEIRSLYKQCSFSLYPSHSEGFGLPVIEAGFCCRLCLCGDNSSMKEIQTNAAYRINTNSEEAWITQMLYYWQNIVTANIAGEECKRMADRFTWKTSAKCLLEALLK